MSTRSEQTVQKILQGASTCFAKYGLEKTSLEDIAKQAAVGRQSIYRLIGGREEVIEAVLADSLARSTAEIKNTIVKCRSFKQAIIKGALVTVKVLRHDQALAAILHDRHDMHFGQYLLASDTPAALQFKGMWQDTFTQAKRDQEIKSTIGFNEFSDWVRSICYILMIREDIDEKQQSRFIERLMLPALIDNK